MRLLFAIKEISTKISKDNISGYAAQSCFFIVLSFIPFIMLLLSLLRFFPISYTLLDEIVESVIPSQIHPMINDIISALLDRSSLTLTSATAIGTLWASGKGFMSLIKGFNSVYDITETRNWVFQRILASLYTLIFLVLIAVSLILLVFGNKLLDYTSGYFPHVASVIYAILSSRFIIFPSVLVLVFMTMYKMLPSRKTSLIREFPGALVAAIGWYLFSYFYSVYVNSSTTFSNMYGSLTTLVFAFVWLYSCINILFFGAEFNTFIEHSIINHNLFKKTKLPK